MKIKFEYVFEELATNQSVRKENLSKKLESYSRGGVKTYGRIYCIQKELFFTYETYCTYDTSRYLTLFHSIFLSAFKANDAEKLILSTFVITMKCNAFLQSNNNISRILLLGLTPPCKVCT